MVSTLLATGMEKLDAALIKYMDSVDGISHIKQDVYFREGLGDAVDRNDPEVIIMSEFLEGNTLSMEQLIRIIRKKYPEKRIIYILKSEESLNLKTLLFRVGVYDVYALEPKLNVKELMQSIFKPKEWKDVANQVPELEEKNNFDAGDVKVDEEIKYENYVGSIMDDDITEETLNNIIAFWSPRQQSGVTTLATNCAVLLSQVNGPVLLVDLNLENPNVHTQMSVQDEDGNHNLNALCEDIEDRTFKDARMVEYYIIRHNVYTDLHIIPGTILKQQLPNKSELLKALKAIIKYGQATGYTSIIFDVDSGLKNELQLEIFRDVDRVVVPILESPGTVISLQKFFDKEFGPFYPNLLDMKKLRFVLNMASDSEDGQKIKRVIQSYLNKRVEVVVPYSNEIQHSTLIGAPYVREKRPDDQMKPFLETANLIHKVFKIETTSKNNKSFLSVFKKK